MPFVLRAEFSGPCVYVPSSNEDQFEELTVLMVDARQPDPGSQQLAHIPVLIFDLADLHPSTTASFLPLQNSLQGAVFLDREQISFTGAGDQPPLRVFNSDALPDVNQADRFGFNWMPRLENVLAGAGDIVSAAVTAPSPPKTVAARIHLTRGELITSRMSAQAGSYLFWTFKPAGQAVVGDDPSSPIGLDVGLELQIADQACVILEHFDTGARRVLCFAPAIAGTTVTLSLANREPGFVLTGSESGEEVNDDQDFGFLYRLSSDPAIAEQPKPIPQLRIGGATRAGITCGGTVGNPDGD